MSGGSSRDSLSSSNSDSSMGSFELNRGRYPEEQVEPRLSKSEVKEQGYQHRCVPDLPVQRRPGLQAPQRGRLLHQMGCPAGIGQGHRRAKGLPRRARRASRWTALRDHDNDTTGERTWVEKCLYEHGSSLQFRGGNCWDETRTPAEINPTNMLSYEQYIERLAYEAEQHEMSPTFEGLGPSMAADVRQFGSLVLSTTRPYIPDGRSRTALNYPNHVVAVALTAALLRSVVSASLLVVRQSLERTGFYERVGARASRPFSRSSCSSRALATPTSSGRTCSR